MGIESLPEEALHGQAEVEDAVAAVEALVFLGQEIGRQDLLQEGFELGQGGLADLLGGALAAGGQLRPPCREKRRLHVQYIYWTSLTGQLKCAACKRK